MRQNCLDCFFYQAVVPKGHIGLRAFAITKHTIHICY